MNKEKVSLRKYILGFMEEEGLLWNGLNRREVGFSSQINLTRFST